MKSIIFKTAHKNANELMKQQNPEFTSYRSAFSYSLKEAYSDYKKASENTEILISEIVTTPTPIKKETLPQKKVLSKNNVVMKRTKDQVSELYETYFSKITLYVARKTSINIETVEDAFQSIFFKAISENKNIILVNGKKEIRMNVETEITKESIAKKLKLYKKGTDKKDKVFDTDKIKTFEVLGTENIFNISKEKQQATFIIYTTNEVRNSLKTKYNRVVSNFTKLTDTQDNEGKNDSFVVPHTNNELEDKINENSIFEPIANLLRKRKGKERTNEVIEKEITFFYDFTINQYSYEYLAEVHNMELGTVQSKINRIREYLKANLSREAIKAL